MNLLYTTMKAMTEDDPDVILDLPYDYKTVIAQILVESKPEINIKNSLVTHKKRDFVDISDSVKKATVGDLHQNQVAVSHKLFRGLSTDNFVFRLAFTR